MKYCTVLRAVAAAAPVIIVALTPLRTSLAACESELRSLEESRHNCDDLSKASQVGGTAGMIVGSVICPWCGVAGLVTGGVPGLAAKHNCERVLPGKQRGYDQCLARVEREQEAQLAAQQKIREDEERRASNQRNTDARAMAALEMAKEAFQSHKETLVHKYAEAGYDITNPQLQSVIEQDLARAQALVKHHAREVESLRSRLNEAGQPPDTNAFDQLDATFTVALSDLLDEVSL